MNFWFISALSHLLTVAQLRPTTGPRLPKLRCASKPHTYTYSVPRAVSGCCELILNKFTPTLKHFLPASDAYEFAYCCLNGTKFVLCLPSLSVDLLLGREYNPFHDLGGQHKVPQSKALAVLHAIINWAVSGLPKSHSVEFNHSIVDRKAPHRAVTYSPRNYNALYNRTRTAFRELTETGLGPVFTFRRRLISRKGANREYVSTDGRRYICHSRNKVSQRFNDGESRVAAIKRKASWRLRGDKKKPVVEHKKSPRGAPFLVKAANTEPPKRDTSDCIPLAVHYPCLYSDHTWKIHSRAVEYRKVFERRHRAEELESGHLRSEKNRSSVNKMFKLPTSNFTDFRFPRHTRVKIAGAKDDKFFFDADDICGVEIPKPSPISSYRTSGSVNQLIQLVHSYLKSYHPARGQLFFDKFISVNGGEAVIRARNGNCAEVIVSTELYEYFFTFACSHAYRVVYCHHHYGASIASVISDFSAPNGMCYQEHYYYLCVISNSRFCVSDIDLGNLPRSRSFIGKCVELLGEWVKDVAVAGRKSSKNVFHCDNFVKSFTKTKNLPAFIGAGEGDEVAQIEDSEILSFIKNTLAKTSSSRDSLLQMSTEKDAIEFKNELKKYTSLKAEYVIPHRVSETVQVALTHAYPQYRLIFTHSKASGHAAAAASRLLENITLTRLCGSDYSDVGGSYGFHLVNGGASKIHVCCPVYDVKDAQRSVIARHELENIARGASDEALAEATTKMTVCTNTLGVCQVKSKSIMMVQVYDATVDDMVNAMLIKGAEVLHFTMITPGELLDGRESFFVDKLDCEIVTDAGAGLVFYKYGCTTYTHNYTNIVRTMKTSVIVKDGNLFSFEMYDIKCGVNYYKVVRTPYCPGINTVKILRYRRACDGLVRVKVPKLDSRKRVCIPSYDDVYIDYDFVRRVLEYVVANCTVVNAKTHEWLCGYVKSSKSRVVISGKVIHRDVELEPKYLGGFVAIMLVAGVQVRSNSEHQAKHLKYTSGDVGLIEMFLYLLNEKCSDVYSDFKKEIKSYLVNLFGIGIDDTKLRLDELLVPITKFAEVTCTIELEQFGTIKSGMIDDSIREVTSRVLKERPIASALNEIGGGSNSDKKNPSRGLKKNSGSLAAGDRRHNLNILRELLDNLLHRLRPKCNALWSFLKCEAVISSVRAASVELYDKVAKLLRCVRLLYDAGVLVVTDVAEVVARVFLTEDDVLSYRALKRLISYISDRIVSALHDAGELLSEKFLNVYLQLCSVLGRAAALTPKIISEFSAKYFSRWRDSALEGIEHAVCIETIASVTSTVLYSVMVSGLGALTPLALISHILKEFAVEMCIEATIIAAGNASFSTFSGEVYRETVNNVLSNLVVLRPTSAFMKLIICSGVVPNLIRRLLCVRLDEETNMYVGYVNHSLDDFQVVIETYRLVKEFVEAQIDDVLMKLVKKKTVGKFKSYSGAAKNLMNEFKASFLNNMPKFFSGGDDDEDELYSPPCDPPRIFWKSRALPGVSPDGDSGFRCESSDASRGLSGGSKGSFKNNIFSYIAGLYRRLLDALASKNFELVSLFHEMAAAVKKKLLEIKLGVRYSMPCAGLVGLLNDIIEMQSYREQCGLPSINWGEELQLEMIDGVLDDEEPMFDVELGEEVSQPPGGLRAGSPRRSSRFSFFLNKFATFVGRWLKSLVPVQELIAACSYYYYGYTPNVRGFAVGTFIKNPLRFVYVNLFVNPSSSVTLLTELRVFFRKYRMRRLVLLTDYLLYCTNKYDKCEFRRTTKAVLESLRRSIDYMLCPTDAGYAVNNERELELVSAAAEVELQVATVSPDDAFFDALGEIEFARSASFELNRLYDAANIEALTLLAQADDDTLHDIYYEATSSEETDDVDDDVVDDLYTQYRTGLFGAGVGVNGVFRSVRTIVKLIRRVTTLLVRRRATTSAVASLWYPESLLLKMTSIVSLLTDPIESVVSNVLLKPRALDDALNFCVLKLRSFNFDGAAEIVLIANKLVVDYHTSGYYKHLTKFLSALEWCVKGGLEAVGLVNRTSRHQFQPVPTRYVRELTDVASSSDYVRELYDDAKQIRMIVKGEMSELREKKKFFVPQAGSSNLFERGESSMLETIVESDEEGEEPHRDDDSSTRANLVNDASAEKELEKSLPRYKGKGKLEVPGAACSESRVNKGCCKFLNRLNTVGGTITPHPVCVTCNKSGLCNAVREFYFMHEVALFELHSKLAMYYEQLKVAGFNRRLSRCDEDSELHVYLPQYKRIESKDTKKKRLTEFLGHEFCYDSRGLVPFDPNEISGPVLLHDQLKFVAANSFLRANDMGKVFDYTNESCRSRLYEAPPGGGKTTTLVSLYLEHFLKVRCVVLTANKNSQIEISDRIDSMIKKNRLFEKPGFASAYSTRKAVMTIDSYLMNHRDVKCSSLFIDECYMVHSGAVIACIEYSQCKACTMFGDSRQIHYIDRNELVKCELSNLDNYVPNENRVYGSVSYRCPWDVCRWLSESYPEDIRTTNTASVGRSSMSIKEIESVEDVPLDPEYRYLTFLQSEKVELDNYAKKEGVPIKVDTVHEVQGATLKNVYLVRTKFQEASPFLNDHHVTVALSRHTDRLVYAVLSGRSLDYVATQIQNATKYVEKFRVNSVAFTGSFIDLKISDEDVDNSRVKATSSPWNVINDFLNAVVPGSSTISFGDMSSELSAQPFESGASEVSIRDSAPPEKATDHDPQRV